MDDELTGLARQTSLALKRRDPLKALQIVEMARSLKATPRIFLDKALALRMLGQNDQAIAALDEALILEPTHFVALLSKGSLLDQIGHKREAVRAYKAAIAVAAPDPDFPPDLAAAYTHAKAVVAADSVALVAYLKDSLAVARAQVKGDELDRFDESLEIFAGVKQVFTQKPLLFHYPRLPAIPYYDRSVFPWFSTLEAASELILAELKDLLTYTPADFVPYVAFPPGIPINQWGELNHSRRWSSYFLWRNGIRQDHACDLCPNTTKLLASLPLAEQRGYAPTALFSTLDAHTRIPPHTGSTNTRLVVHLPLILPGRAWFRVGNVTREWRLGEAWAFDDTIEHEASNESDEPRTILIFDIWNPFLSDAERALVTEMMIARRTYEGETEASDVTVWGSGSVGQARGSVS